MNYFLLAETEFFRRINEAGDCNMETAYTAFATQVIELCSGNVDTNRTIIALPIHTSAENTTENTTGLLQWTGNTLDLVELIYGLDEMGCINNGETSLKELSAALYEFFGIKTKECYRYYSAIKLRKNTSRTYFLDKMLAKLNEKIRHDEEMERMRR